MENCEVKFTILISVSVKAAGVLCVLGISFGIGTYVLYKIYDKYFKPKGRSKQSRADHTVHRAEDEFCHVVSRFYSSLVKFNNYASLPRKCVYCFANLSHSVACSVCLLDDWFLLTPCQVIIRHKFGVVFSSTGHRPASSCHGPLSVVRPSVSPCVRPCVNFFFKHLLLWNYLSDFDDISQKCSCHGPLQNFLKEFDSFKNFGCYGNKT